MRHRHPSPTPWNHVEGAHLALEEALEHVRTRSIARLIDRAHAELPSEELALLLLAIRGGGGPNAAGHGGRRLSPAAVAALVPIQRLLGPPPGPGSWLDAYLDEVASRPRGAALAA